MMTDEEGRSCNFESYYRGETMNANCLFSPSSPPQLFSLRSPSSVSPSVYSRTGVSDDVAVECRNLCFSATTRPRITVPILRDCSFRIPSGQLWMLLGPNGCGKSTLLNRPIQTLSGGQRQRVAIAGALAEACKVLLLDELTTFLDESDQLGVIKAVKELINAKKGGDVTALWVTHRLEELEYADGAVYMENGRAVRHGDAAIILDFIKAKQSSYIDQIGF